MKQTDIFDTPLLKQLIRSGKAGKLIAQGVPGGFLLAMQEDLDRQILVSQRGRHRKFRRLDAVAAYLKSIGGKEFSVDLGQWQPTSPSLPL